MTNADILIKISPILETFNIRQRTIANQLLADKNYSFVDYQGEVCIIEKSGQLYNFIKFVKAKCNCN